MIDTTPENNKEPGPQCPDATPVPACCKCAAYREIIADQAQVIADMRKEEVGAVIHTEAIVRYLHKSLEVKS